VAHRKLIVNLTRGTVVCEEAVLADNPALRMRGLLGRRELPSGAGMLLRPAPAIHSVGMRFAFDALFLDDDLRVLRIVEGLRPWRMAAQRGAHSVLEIASGESARRGVAVGDRLALLDPAERVEWSAGSMASCRAGGGPGDGESVPVGHADVPDSDSMRVLLAASDRRFRHTASLLLTRRGCAVSVADSLDAAAETATGEGAEVVVLDAGRSLTDAARTVAVLETLTPPVGVIVVADDPEQGLLHLPVLDRWGSFDILFAAIEEAHRQRVHRRSLVERD